MVTKIEKSELASYEIGYLLTPLIPEEGVGEAAERLFNAPLAAAQATLTSSGVPKMIPLAYRIKKMIDNRYQTYSQAYFGSLRFSVAPEAVAQLETTWRQAPELVRFLLINLPATEGETGFAPRRPARPEAAPPADPADRQEVIDKEIDGLLEPAAA